MFLRNTNRRKDGKDHRYYSVVDTCRVRDGRTVQKTLAHLAARAQVVPGGFIETLMGVFLVVEMRQSFPSRVAAKG